MVRVRPRSRTVGVPNQLIRFTPVVLLTVVLALVGRIRLSSATDEYYESGEE